MSDAGRPVSYAVLSCADVDSAAADEVQSALENAGVRVWRYRADILPGQDSRAEIRQAVSCSALAFLAFFSKAGLGVKQSPHYEELLLAVSELRRRQPLAAWLIPVRLDDCEVPDVDLGGGRTLLSLKAADLFGAEREKELKRLVKAVIGLQAEGRAQAPEGSPGFCGRLSGAPSAPAPSAALDRLPPRAAASVGRGDDLAGLPTRSDRARAREIGVTAQSPAATSGGIDGKWGLRYEARWSIWRGVLPVLRGEFDAIQVEPPDLLGEGAEFRLFGRQPTGPDEVHQCKRHHGTSWTVLALDREHLLVPFGRHLAAGTSVVFASGTESVLRTLAEKARRNEPDDGLDDLNQREAEAKAYLMQRWAVSEREVRRRLASLEVRTIDDETLLACVIESIDSFIVGAEEAKAALLYLADFVIDNVRVRLTGRILWDFLRSKGFSLREGQDPALSERIFALKDNYVRGIEALRPQNLAVLGRAEVNRVVEGLTLAGGPRIVVLTGPPGSGKSTVLALVCVRLSEMGIVAAPLRLDAAQEAWTADALGCQKGIGFGGPPARITARAAGGEKAVLVVDQLDSLSLLNGRGDQALDGVRDMLTEARASDKLRVLIASREYDLENDPRLRVLVYGNAAGEPGIASPDVLHLTIGNLEEKQVQEALAALGFEPGTLSARFKELVASPFNLSLVANLAQDPRSTFRDFNLLHDRHDLLAAYDARLRQRTRSVLGPNGFTSAVHKIAAALSETGMLSTAREVFADIPDTVDTLVYEGVLVEHVGQLRFFHEEYFNFVFARQHLQTGRGAADLIQDDIQDLVRRGQVSAILAQQRRDQSQSYEIDLRTVLDAGRTRSHLRAAVLAWLTDRPDADDHELRLVTELAVAPGDPLKRLALWTLCSRPFGNALCRHGLLAVAVDAVRETHAQGPGQLADLIRQLGAEDCGILLSETARHHPEQVSAELVRLAADRAITLPTANVVLRSVFLAGPAAGAVTADLFCMVTGTIAEAAEIQSARHASSRVAPAPGGHDVVQALVAALYAVHGPGVLALATLAQRSSVPATRAIHVYLTAAARVSRTRGGHHAFDIKGPLPHQRTGLDIYAKVAEREPKEFAAALTPFLIEQLQLAANLGLRHLPAGNRSGQSPGLRYDGIFGAGSLHYAQHDELYSALRHALRWCAAEAPDAASALIGQLTDTDLVIAHRLAAAALSACAQTLLPDALSWASLPAVRGLSAGMTTSWAWGEVLAHVAATGDSAQRAAALNLAMQPYQSVDLRAVGRSEDQLKTVSADEASRARTHRARAVEQIVALTLIKRRLGIATPAAVKVRLAQLEQILGPVPTVPDPQRVTPSQTQALNAAALAISDTQWTTILRQPIASSDQSPLLPAPAVTPDITDQLEIAAKQNPARFAQLLTSIGPTAQPDHIRVILRAITSVAPELPAEPLAPIVQLTQAVSSWQLAQLNRSLCALISALASRDLPDGIIAAAATIAVTSKDPAASATLTTDPVTAGWNTDRGQGLITLANLLAPADTRQHRARLMADALTAAVGDPAEHVRTMLPPVIVGISSINPATADQLTQQWLSKASDSSLRAPELDSLAWQLLTQAKATGAELVQRMLRSADPEVRTRGGMLAALASLEQIKLHVDDATPDIQTLLQIAFDDAAARNGMAILMAQRVDDLPGQPDGQSPATDTAPTIDRALLIRLLNDLDEQVRQSAAQYPLHLTTPCDHAGLLLSATAVSRAFAEHPAATLHLLRRPAAALPLDATLDLCERWLAIHAGTAGDIRTSAAGDAYFIVDIALSAHARTATGSEQRRRTLTLLDQLIEAGVIEANSKVDAMAYKYI